MVVGFLLLLFLFFFSFHRLRLRFMMTVIYPETASAPELSTAKLFLFSRPSIACHLGEASSQS